MWIQVYISASELETERIRTESYVQDISKFCLADIQIVCKVIYSR
jgi:hypothetical protein